MGTDTDFWIKKGDTSPAIEATLEDSKGDAIDLSSSGKDASSVDFHMVDSADNTIVDSSATFVDKANGKVSYSWSSGDTDEAGLFEAEWEVTYNDGTIETFPNFENLVVNITDELA